MSGLNSVEVARLINIIVENSILYGGDRGGPYCTDEESLAQIVDGLSELISLFEMDNFEVIVQEFPRIELKNL